MGLIEEVFGGNKVSGGIIMEGKPAESEKAIWNRPFFRKATNPRDRDPNRPGCSKDRRFLVRPESRNETGIIRDRFGDYFWIDYNSIHATLAFPGTSQ